MLWLNPATHIDTHTSGSLSAAALQLNWLQRGGCMVVPPGTTHSAKAAAAVAASGGPAKSPSHESGRDTSFSSLCPSHAPCLALTTNLMLNRDDKT